MSEDRYVRDCSNVELLRIVEARTMQAEFEAQQREAVARAEAKRPAMLAAMRPPDLSEYDEPAPDPSEEQRFGRMLWRCGYDSLEEWFDD